MSQSCDQRRAASAAVSAQPYTSSPAPSPGRAWLQLMLVVLASVDGRQLA
jgi:hypothetical protein